MAGNGGDGEYGDQGDYDGDAITLVVKNADGVTADLHLEDVPLEYSVKDVKTRISENYSERPCPSALKIVHSGRLLRDVEKLEDVFVLPSSTVVIHVLVRNSTHMTPKTPSQPSPQPADTPPAAANPAPPAPSPSSQQPASVSSPLPPTSPSPTAQIPQTPPPAAASPVTFVAPPPPPLAPWAMAPEMALAWPGSQQAAMDQVYQVYYQAYYAAYLAHFTAATSAEATPSSETGCCTHAPVAAAAAAAAPAPLSPVQEDEAAARPPAQEAVPAAEAQRPVADLNAGARANNNGGGMGEDLNEEEFGERRQHALVLALKLAFFVWALGQDAPKERLYALVVCALAIFLHQTGILRIPNLWPFPNVPAPHRPPEDRVHGLNREDRGDDENEEGMQNGEEGNEDQGMGRGVDLTGPAGGGGEGLSGLLVDVLYLVVGFFTSLVPENQQQIRGF